MGYGYIYMSILKFDNVTKIYKKGFFEKKIPAVQNLSFAAEGKKITGFVGPNGAGKTTSIKMLLGLVRPTSGVITIKGITAQDPHARRSVAYVSEQPYFYPYLSIQESLQFSYRLCGYNPADLTREIQRVLHLVQLSDIAQKKIHELSKGMQQRLNMAHALVGNPEIFIFDEPMSGLDPIGRRLFREIFRSLSQQGKCIFFSTHILEDIESLCDSVVVLSKGNLVYAGDIDQLLSRGILGTEILVEGLQAKHLDYLGLCGTTVTSVDSSKSLIFIPTTDTPQKSLQYLVTQNIYPISIKPRMQSLESILYKDVSKG